MISNLRSTALYYRFLYTTEVRTDHAVQRTDHGLRNAHRPGLTKRMTKMLTH